MQSKLLHSFRGLSSQDLNFHHYFHTSACLLARPKKFNSRASNNRASARKRLVPSLKDGSRAGKYEVAPRQFNSEGRDARFRSKSKSIRENWKDRLPYSPSSRQDSRSQPHDRSSHPERAPQRGFDYGERRRLDNRNTPLKTPWQNNTSSAPSPKLIRETAPHGGKAHETRKRYETFPDKNAFIGRDRMPSQRNHFGGDRNAVSKASWQERIKQNIVNTMPLYDHGHKRLSRSPKVKRLPEDEFELSTPLEPVKTLPPQFSSPPLLEGLLKSVHEVLGPTTKATAIQSLSLKHLFTPPTHLSPSDDIDPVNKLSSPVWNQYLLASETGSGKSIAYMLPMIQYLKLTENFPVRLPDSAPPPPNNLTYTNPRGLILAPTHELSRQLSSFAKALLHNVRLRVMCTSQANTFSLNHGRNSTASQLKRELSISDFGLTGESQFSKKSRPIDILVSTPNKMLEMTRGWGWDKADKIEDDWDEARKERARKWVPGKPDASLGLIEWVVVDEADILFDRDFQETTRLLLADIARARGYDHPSFSSLKTTFMSSPHIPNAMPPIAYPFNLVLTSATIPLSLSTYLSANHPELIRLASPKLHQLPSTLKTEHYAYAGGNKNADVEKRIRSVWAEDSVNKRTARSKVLVFCNKSNKVDDLHLYLKEKGIANIPLTSDGQARQRGSNRHLAGFLKTKDEEANPLPANTSTDPHVMITTSLLSRGLDFSPQIKHVFILDEPRNMIDFLHRAGRSGRAGNEGHVVIFGKMKGRGSASARDVKKKIYALAR